MIVRRYASIGTRGDIGRLIDGALSINNTATGNAVGRQRVERELAKALLHAVEQGSSTLPSPGIGRPRHSRSRVIASALAFMQAHEGQPLFIEDLCRATHVSERALRNIFQEYFGVGPMRLLMAQQLHAIRDALLRAGPGSDTVTRIAARFGVIDGSLLARNYKALLGESRSQTLGRPALESTMRLRADWLQLASRLFSADPTLMEL